jgi:hypothetical protein
MQTSSRRGIQYPNLDRSDRPDVPAHIKNLVDALELDPSLNMGAAASRPANPGYARYFYWATDTKVLSFWDGSAWTAVGSVDLIPQTLIDAKGDLIVGLSDNIAGRLALGTNGYTLQVDNTQPQGVKWGLNVVLDLIASKGDLLAGTGADALARVAVGADGQTVIADSAQTAGIRWGAPVIPSWFVKLGADVPLTAANTPYDGPSQTLNAGTYKIDCTATITRGGNAPQCSCKIWDGTDVISSAMVGTEGLTNGEAQSSSMSGIYVCTSTKTVKLTVTPSTTTGVLKAALPANSAGNNATHLVIVQIG